MSQENGTSRPSYYLQEYLGQIGACYPRHGSRGSFFRMRATGFEGACSMTYQPIENYGMIGDMHTVALVGTDGSIDWLCVPRFDSPSVDGKGGRFKIAPVGDDVTCKQVLLARDQRLDYTVSRTARGCRAHRLHARGPGSLGRQAPSPTHTTRHRGSRHPQVPHGMPAGVQLRPGCAHCHNHYRRSYAGFNFAQPWSRHRAAP